MNIVQITPGLPPKPGGIERYVASSSLALAELGHHLTIIAPSPGNHPYSNAFTDGTEILIREFKSFNLFSDPASPSLLAALVRSVDADIVISHGYMTFVSASAALAKKMGLISCLIHTFHGDGEVTSRARHLISGLRNPTQGRAIISWNDAVITLTESGREMVSGLDHKKNLFVAPNAVWAREFSSKSHSDPTEEKTSTRSVLFIARLFPEKRPELLVQAVPHIRTDCTILIAGDGPLKTMIEHLASKESLDGKIRILGRISNDEKHGLLSSCDVAVSTSRYEGMQGFLLEAMASGKPVVATSAPGNSDLVTDGVQGLLCNSSPEDVADKIDQVLRNESRARKMGRRGRRLVETKYNWPIVARRLENIYDEVVSG